MIPGKKNVCWDRRPGTAVIEILTAATPVPKSCTRAMSMPSRFQPAVVNTTTGAPRAVEATSGSNRLAGAVRWMRLDSPFVRNGARTPLQRSAASANHGATVVTSSTRRLATPPTPWCARRWSASRDGTWAAFEVKLGRGAVDGAAQTLLRVAARVDPGKHGKPAVLGAITGWGYGCRRPGGVTVIPIGALAP